MITTNFKSLLTIGTVIVFGLATPSCNRVPNTGSVELTNSIDSLSYALGYTEANSVIEKLQELPFDSISRIELGRAFAATAIKEEYSKFRTKQFEEIDYDIFMRGFLNQFVYKKSYFSEIGADVYLRERYKSISKEREAKKSALGEANLKRGEEFLAKNREKDGIVCTESGLQYRVINSGDGVCPEANDKIRCIYHGTLIDGTVFDSSRDKGDTLSTYIRGVIPGWKEALKIMSKGAKWEIYLPANLGYGKSGSSKIGPNETLIFEIEFVDIVQKKKKSSKK